MTLKIFNGRCNDGVRTVHRVFYQDDSPYAACNPPRPYPGPHGLYLSVLTRKPVTCKKCLKMVPVTPQAQRTQSAMQRFFGVSR